VGPGPYRAFVGRTVTVTVTVTRAVPGLRRYTRLQLSRHHGLNGLGATTVPSPIRPNSLSDWKDSTCQPNLRLRLCRLAITNASLTFA
jgi:hypothetical protein